MYLTNSSAINEPIIRNDSVPLISNSPKAEDHKVNLSVASIAVVTCFLCVVIVMTVLGNSIALIAFSIYRPLRTVTNYFLINLCISDITVATICMPFWISYILTGWPSALNGGIYVFWVCLDIFCGTWSIMSLAMISIERYLCIGFPLYYQNLVTKKRTVLMVVFVLLYSIMSSLLGFAEYNLQIPTISIIIFLVSYVVPVIIKSFTYGKIYKEAKRQQKFINQEEKVRLRLTEQRHLFAVDRIQEEKPLGNQEIKMPIEVNQSCQRTEIPMESVVKVSIEERRIQKSAEKATTMPAVSNIANDLASDSVIASLRSVRFSATGQLSWCCRRKEMEMQSPKSRPLSSGDTELTYECSDQQLTNNKCCSESYDELRRLGIDDWNSYLDRLEDVALTNITGSRKDRAHFRREDVEAEDDSSCDTSGINKALIPLSIGHATALKQGLQPTDEKMERNLTFNTMMSSLPKVKEKQSRSRLLRSKSVKFFKSESLIEMKQKGLGRIKRLQREVKASKVIGRIIGTFLLLWTPFMMVVILSSLNVHVSMATVITTKCLHYANSAINPILYVVLNKNFKKALRRMMRIVC